MFFKKSTPFAQVFFHDIKNKLTSVKFSLSILDKKNIPETKKKELLKNIKHNIDSIIEMIKEFIELEKYKKSKLKNEKFDLFEIIEEILTELKVDIEKKKIEVIVKKEYLPIFSNKEWLKKALFNIIHNAIKFNKYKGTIFIKINKEKNGYLLIIKDTGQGIEKERLKEIFKKYHSTDKKYGSGIGLNLSKIVIENIGGSIAVISEENRGTQFFIYLPKTSKAIKIKRLAAMLSSVAIVTLFSIDYFYCLIPQKIEIKTSPDMKIYKLENNIILKTNINDSVKIKAYKNILSTNYRSEFIIKKADAIFETNQNRLKVIAHNQTIKNYGTNFELISDKEKFATSVYKGAIRSNNIDVKENEGIYLKNGKVIKTLLPLPVKSIKIINNTLKWSSPYKTFTLIFARDKNFEKELIKYQTSKKEFNLEINDGYWYISIQSVKNNLLSKPKIIKYLSLYNYNKALKAYINKDYALAKSYLQKSLLTINKASYKPYYLKALIDNDLKYAKIAYSIEKNNKTKTLLGRIYYQHKKYKKSIELLKDTKEYLILAKDYYYLNNLKKSKYFLYKVLETNPYNKEAIIMMIKILKKEQNRALLDIFENKLKELNDRS